MSENAYNAGSSPDLPELENPFVGPRSIPTGKPLFGRDREVRDLFRVLVADRIVLLHGPSGSGKSSLVNAGLIPGWLFPGPGARAIPSGRSSASIPSLPATARLSRSTATPSAPSDAGRRASETRRSHT